MLDMLQWFQQKLYILFSLKKRLIRLSLLETFKILKKKNDRFHGELTRSAYIALKLTKSYLNTI